ncbi:MAG: LacI family DNA-binding transcriptional regulator [Planctomycetota bacterium]
MATVYDIAKAAGVSYSTATRVLNGRANYTRPTFAKRAAKIRKIANDMGYRPHAAARAMSSGKFDAIGIVIRRGEKFGLGPHPGYLRGICAALEPMGRSLVVAPVRPDALTADADPRVLSEKMVDGLLIGNHDALGLEADTTIDQLHIPAVWLNSKREFNAVYPDDFGGAKKATEHLLQLGHKRIAFAGSPDSGHYSSNDRVAGYAAAMKAAGLTPRDAIWSESQSIRRSLIETAIMASDRPTAFLVMGDLHEAVLFAAAKLGIEVPKDLSVLAIDHGQATGGYVVDTHCIPAYHVGVHGTQMLAERIDSPSAEPKRAMAVPYQNFMPGETLAKASS